jgi:hypothetical protein
MTLPVLKKIRDMVKAGAKVTGIKPEKSPGLSDNDTGFQSIVTEIWSKNNPNVSVSQNYSDILRESNIPEDVRISNAKSKILYVHRRTDEEDIYWLNNRSENANEAEISFRVTDKTPELWHAQTGKTEKVSYQIKDGRTIIPLKFESWDAYFIVFKENTTINAYTKPAVTEKQILSITGPWKVNFQEGRGAPQNATFEKLTSYTEHTDAGVKYFSGTGTYTKTITADKNWFNKGAQLWIDLGDVKNIAEVKVNGKSLGIVWKKPFRLDVTSALKPGSNTLVIKVTNLWVNRLIGDAQPGVTHKITYTTMPFYQANSKLLPSGLLGPVRLFSMGK